MDATAFFGIRAEGVRQKYRLRSVFNAAHVLTLCQLFLQKRCAAFRLSFVFAACFAALVVRFTEV
jgi:hypothetical protein